MTLNELNMLLPEDKQKSACLNEFYSAQVVGVSPSSLSNYRKKGLGPEYLKVDNGKRGRVLYPKTALCNWLNQTIKTA
jgi:hypothetical protein